MRLHRGYCYGGFCVFLLFLGKLRSGNRNSAGSARQDKLEFSVQLSLTYFS